MRMNSLVRFCLCLIGVVCYAQISPPPSGGGGASFPAATGPNQPLLSTGAGTTYAAGSYALNLGGDFTTIGQALRLVNGYSGIQTVFYPYISSFTTVGAEVVNTFTNNNIFSGTLTVGPNNFFACVGATVCLIDKTSGTGTTLLEVGTDSGGSTSAVSTQLTIRNGASQGTVNPFQINNSSGSAVFSISPTGVVTGSGFPAVSGSGITLTNPTGAVQTITMPNAASVTLARTDAGQTFTGVQTFSTAPVLSSLSANVLLLVNGSNVINSTGPTFNPANSIGTWGNLTLQGNAGQIQGSGAGWQIGGVAIGPSNTSPGTGTASFLDRTATTGATAVCIGCDFASHTSATTTQLTIQDGAGQSTTAQLQGKNSSGAVTWSITGGGQINSGNIINTGGGGYAGNYYQDQLFLKGYFSTAAANVNWQNINRITTNVNMQIQGIASQTADLLQFTNASAPSTILAKFDSGGNFVETGTITYNGNSPPTNSVVCYKAGGVLGYATNTSGVIGTTCN